MTVSLENFGEPLIPAVNVSHRETAPNLRLAELASLKNPEALGLQSISHTQAVSSGTSLPAHVSNSGHGR